MRLILNFALLLILSIGNTQAQVDIGLKTGIQAVGFIKTLEGSSIINEGGKFNLSYGLRVSHPLGKRIDLSLDIDYTGGENYSARKSTPDRLGLWRQLDYRLLNTSVLFSFSPKERFSIKTGLHIIFVGEIKTRGKNMDSVSGIDGGYEKQFPPSHAIGLPIALAYVINKFELEVKWVNAPSVLFKGTSAYFRLETFSLNLFYNFYSK